MHVLKKTCAGSKATASKRRPPRARISLKARGNGNTGKNTMPMKNGQKNKECV